MTQIRVTPTANSPQTHALVIGVGHHDHLLGGTSPNPDIHLGLRVLQSPPVSAINVAGWLLGFGPGPGLNNPAAPLGSVEVLVSVAPGAQLPHQGKFATLDPAKHTEVKQGFGRWLQEMKRHPRNVGLLYFCGHGVTGSNGTQYVLLQDFGSDPLAPFTSGIFDMNSTVRALESAVQGQLFVFVDACRNNSPQLADLIGAKPAPLLQQGGSTKIVNSGLTTIYSSRAGMSAYGDREGMTRFTKALLLALEGYCGSAVAGKVHSVIDGLALSQAMPKLLRFVNESSPGEPQTCESTPSGNDAPLHVLPGLPRVRVQIDISPEKMRSCGTFLMQDITKPGAPPVTGGGNAGVWEADAFRGIYRVEVSPKKKEFTKLLHEHQFVDPPIYRLPVEVK